MLIVPETEIAALMTRADAFEAVESVFASMATKAAYNFPVVREAIGHADALYGFKSGFDRDGLALGLKSGGYWPGNAAKGMTNHQSTVFLFDADTGRPSAIVGGNLLTALRTAAAAAVSVDRLARKDAKVLGVVGAGHQSPFQLRAVAETRGFEKVVAWNRTPGKMDRLAAAADEAGLAFEETSLEELGAQADVIVTIASSHTPILLDAHVRPGTHIACMGTDTKGKQEVDAALLARATLFTDEPAQSTTIGECQHAPEGAAPVEIGSVVNGVHPGRTSAQEITLFDGTGVGLQDLAAAAKVVERAKARGVGFEADF